MIQDATPLGLGGKQLQLCVKTYVSDTKRETTSNGSSPAMIEQGVIGPEHMKLGENVRSDSPIAWWQNRALELN